MECSINNPALSLSMKHLVIGQRQKAPNFSAFHWSPHGSLVSIGQHFITTRVVHLPKRTETSLITKSDQSGLNHQLERENSLKNDDIDIYATNITECITKYATKHIPNKDIKVRKSDPAWLTNNIKRLMRKRKRLYDKYKRSKDNADFGNYKNVRNKVTYEIRKSKKYQIEKLTEKLESNNLNQKDWWRTLKTFIKPEQSLTVPPLCKDDIIYTNDKDKANILNQFFTEQSTLDDSNASLPSINHALPYKLDSISVTSLEVEDILISILCNHREFYNRGCSRMVSDFVQTY